MDELMHAACLLAGSNIDPHKNLARGIALLQLQVQVVRQSSVWQSPSVGSDGPDFLNLALEVHTELEMEALKEEVLRPLETRLGRIRTHDKNAPRTLDLDIITFDGKVVDPALFLHAHRAVPVAELLPDLSTGGISLRQAALELAKNTPIHQISNSLINS